MSKWKEYSDKFDNITLREQYLILITGLVAIVFISFSLFVDSSLIEIEEINDKSGRLISESKSIQSSISIFQEALTEDPNKVLNKQISTYEAKVKEVDDKLLLLTSELIDPIQMRFALLEMLQVQKGVSLISFELLGAQPLMNKEGDLVDKSIKEESLAVDTLKKDATEVEPTINLYQHGIKLKLTGKYFQLRDYLTQLEAMQWKFFWKDFRYTIKEYPLGELEIELYSLSVNEEFIGV